MTEAPTFALIGAAGYVAPKHGAAIKAVGGELVAACDVHDAVGWLDADWPECEFDAVEKTQDLVLIGDLDEKIITSICTPNDTHARYVSAALGMGSVICEKPLVLRSEDLEFLTMREEKSGERVYTILNLRHQAGALAAKRHAETKRPEKVAIRYVTPRGPWYDTSWKGDPARSGGLVFNIGIHILDWILWAFGPAQEATLIGHDDRAVEFETIHKHAMYRTTRVSTYLSTRMGQEPDRRIWMNGSVFDLSNRFADLHVKCYEEILAGRGPGIEEARPSIELAERLTGQMGGTMPKIAISKIQVNSRIRHKMGSIKALAKSIRDLGLLHPIVVTDDDVLVVGQRRLEACRLLGWTKIDATRKSDLAERELREIELEENLRRKNLTKEEKAEGIRLAREQADGNVCARIQKPRRGPKPKGQAKQSEVAEGAGVDQATVSRHERQDALVERFPFMGAWSQRACFRFDDRVKDLPSEDVDRLGDVILESGAPAEAAIPMAESLLAMEPDRRGKMLGLCQSDDERDQVAALQSLARIDTNGAAADPRILPYLDAERIVRKQAEKFPDDPMNEEIIRDADMLQATIDKIRKYHAARREETMG